MMYVRSASNRPARVTARVARALVAFRPLVIITFCVAARLVMCALMEDIVNACACVNQVPTCVRVAGRACERNRSRVNE